MTKIRSPRFLVPFHPKLHPHFFTDVLVVGGGLAGLRAALEIDPRLQVLVVCKQGLTYSNSMQAQGGVASVISVSDSFDDHVRDTVIAGGTLCERQTVEYVVRHGPEEIDHLIDWGTHFDEVDGHLALSREGGHRRDRVAHALGDATGKEIMRALIDQIEQRKNIRVWEDTFSLDLLRYEDRCCGAVVYWQQEDEKELVWAKETILATGGIGQIYRETTNPDVATADGIAMAARAGVEIRDMEFVQFHPTVLYIAGSSRSLITEAMRGEGGHLVDRNGNRFMADYDPRGELAPRDVVSSAIVKQMEKTRHPNVYLDVTHLDGPWVRHRFPGIDKTCRKFDLDITRDRIPVRPGAHYAMGGVRVDHQGRTSLAGLWAAGEVSSTGLHGSNRLASNSLLEALVYGGAVGRGVSEAAMASPDQYQAHPIENRPIANHHHFAPLDLGDIRNSLKSLLWRRAGVVRHEDGLREAAENLSHWTRYVFQHQFKIREGWELQNMLTTAQLVVAAARDRRESRGCHVREDYPEKDGSQDHRHSTFRQSFEPITDSAE